MSGFISLSLVSQQMSGEWVPNSSIKSFEINSFANLNLHPKLTGALAKGKRDHIRMPNMIAGSVHELFLLDYQPVTSCTHIFYFHEMNFVELVTPLVLTAWHFCNFPKNLVKTCTRLTASITNLTCMWRIKTSDNNLAQKPTYPLSSASKEIHKGKTQTQTPLCVWR